MVTAWDDDGNDTDDDKHNDDDSGINNDNSTVMINDLTEDSMVMSCAVRQLIVTHLSAFLWWLRGVMASVQYSSTTRSLVPHEAGKENTGSSTLAAIDFRPELP